MAKPCGKDSAVIQVIVTKKTKKQIEEIARKEGRSASGLLRYLAERALDNGLVAH